MQECDKKNFFFDYKTNRHAKLQGIMYKEEEEPLYKKLIQKENDKK